MLAVRKHVYFVLNIILIIMCVSFLIVMIMDIICRFRGIINSEKTTL